MYSKLSLLMLIGFFCLFHEAASAHTASLGMESKTSGAIIDESLVINGPIYITNNERLESVSYPNLKFTNGPIYLYGNDL